MHGFFRGGLSQVRLVASVPAGANLSALRLDGHASMAVIGMNVPAVALWSIGVFASLYAGYLSPNCG